jgi:general secretion pathway protein G
MSESDAWARPRRRSDGTKRAKGGSRGFTFIELLVVTTILLREMRAAIDKFKDAADAGVIGAFDIKAGSEGYPPDLETLVEGVSKVNDQTGTKLKFLRRIPIDPMTHSTEWGLRSYQDRPDATSWGGQNVFDVYTKSTGIALDGTKYRDW